MKTLRVVPVDDEPLARERVATLVRATEGLELVGEGGNGLEALDLIARLDPDLVFIDVEMPELSGFGVVAALDDARVPGIVFITAYEGYALKAFEVGAVDYLHKPITAARFRLAAARARERLARPSVVRTRALVTGAIEAEHERGTRTRFVVRRGHAHVFVPVDVIDWIDVADNYLRLHVGGEAHLSRGTMKQLVRELDPTRFAHIHRSILVAVDRVQSIRTRRSGGYLIVLVDGTRLKGSRLQAERIRALLRRTAD